MKKKQYYILSGEGAIGSWRAVRATATGIKRMLTCERCGGERWAYGYRRGADGVFSDIETGDLRTLPNNPRLS